MVVGRAEGTPQISTVLEWPDRVFPSFLPFTKLQLSPEPPSAERVLHAAQRENPQHNFPHALWPTRRQRVAASLFPPTRIGSPDCRTRKASRYLGPSGAIHSDFHRVCAKPAGSTANASDSIVSRQGLFRCLTVWPVLVCGSPKRLSARKCCVDGRKP